MLTQIDLLKKYNISVRGHGGQHLLIDPNLQRKTVDLLELKPTDSVLEIGPGLGALTGHILGQCRRFVAIEKDPQFVDVLQKEFPEFSVAQSVIARSVATCLSGRQAKQSQRLLRFARNDNRLICANVLDFDFRKLASRRLKWKVISNLPYYITAPIIFHLLGCRTLFSKMVFTLQKEVADRILASPGSKDYGRLSLALRYAVTARHAFDIPPSCFTPRPEVASSVLVLEMNPEKNLLKPAQEKQLFHLIQVAFSQRRKMFLSLLAADPKTGKSREELRGLFEHSGIPATARGEELLLKDYIRLMHQQ